MRYAISGSSELLAELVSNEIRIRTVAVFNALEIGHGALPGAITKHLTHLARGKPSLYDIQTK